MNVEVRFSAATADFKTGLQQVTADLGAAGQKMGDSLKGVGDAAKGAEGAHGGLVSSIQGGISQYAAGAAAGITVAAAIEKIVGAAKESVTWIIESGAAINGLSEQFKELRVTTGTNLDVLNELAAATAMSGQSMDMMSGLMMGWTRGIKANADSLIANGVAADRAELLAMPFKEYLEKVYQISTEMKSPMEANIFLTEALGRSGAQAAPKLKELVENLKENNTAMMTGNLVTQSRIDMQERDEKATGAVSIAYKKLRADVGDSVNSVLVPIKELAGWTLKTKVYQDDVYRAIESGLVTYDHWYDSLDKVANKLKVTLEYFKQLGIAATEAAKGSMDVGTGDAATKVRTLVDPKADKAAAGAAKAAADKLKADRERAAKEAQDSAVASAEFTARELDRIEKDRLTKKKSYEKEAYAIIEQTSSNEIAAAEDEYEKKEALINNDFALGKITEAQKTAALIAALTQREAAIKAAFTKEQSYYGDDTTAYKKLESDKVKQTNTTENQITAIKSAALQKHVKDRIAAEQQITNAVVSSVGQQLASAQNLDEAVKGFANDMKDAVIQYAEQELEKYIMAAMEKKTVAEMSGQGAVGLFAVNSAASASEEGGYIAGAAAAAAAEATGQAYMAQNFAAGGWQIPWHENPGSTQLHGGEHVIPRAIAERYEAGAPGRGGKSGGGNTFNITAMDGVDTMRVLRRSLPAAMKRLQRNGVI